MANVTIPRFQRFSVLTMLLAVALCAVAASLGARWALPRWRERQAALQVYALGGHVFRWTSEDSIVHVDPAELPYLPRIAGVDYWTQRVTAAHVEPLLGLPKLRSISFTGCALEPRALERLGECDSRVDLFLNGCSGCDEAFVGSGAIRVRRVSFRRCDVSEIGLRRVHLPETFWLGAEGTPRLDDAALAAIRANCPDLQHLDLRGCPIATAGCSEIARMPKLQSLWLSGSPAVTNIGWHALSRSLTLKKVHLYGTSISLEQATADGRWRESYGEFTLKRVPASPNKG